MKAFICRMMLRPKLRRLPGPYGELANDSTIEQESHHRGTYATTLRKGYGPSPLVSLLFPLTYCDNVGHILPGVGWWTAAEPLSAGRPAGEPAARSANARTEPKEGRRLHPSGSRSHPIDMSPDALEEESRGLDKASVTRGEKDLRTPPAPSHSFARYSYMFPHDRAFLSSSLQSAVISLEGL